MISDDTSLLQGPTPNATEINSFFTRIENALHIFSTSQHNGFPVGKYWGNDVEGATKYAFDLNTAQNNVYFTVNEPHPDCGHKPNKSQIIRIRAAYVDIDPYKQGVTFDKESAHSAVLVDRPTLVIDSGNGLHVYWELDEPIDATPENVASIETVNRALVARFGGDPAATNVDRVLRVPGTINWPNAKKRALGRVPCMAKVLP